MIGVVDFGSGNTRSVLRALAAVGADARLLREPDRLAEADRLVLPGVGAAPSAITALHARGLWEPVRAWGAAGRPLLGVCLGAQLLLDRSDEGDVAGLGLIPGRCRRLPGRSDGGPRRVPHIGWNEVAFVRHGARRDAYFIHGYWLDPASPAHVVATTDVDGFSFPSVIRAGSVTGTQFHPEKSGAFGRALLAAFAGGLLDTGPSLTPATPAAGGAGAT